MQHGQLDGKMLGALLTGVNRAFPFVKGKVDYKDPQASIGPRPPPRKKGDYKDFCTHDKFEL